MLLSILNLTNYPKYSWINFVKSKVLTYSHKIYFEMILIFYIVYYIIYN